MVFFDQRGHGASEQAAPETYTIAQLGTDLAQIVTYDDRMAAAADQLDLTVARPT